MNFRNSVRARLMLCFGGVILVFGMAVSLGIIKLSAFNNAVREITGAEFSKVETANAWAASVFEAMRHARNMLIVEGKNEIQGEVVKLGELSAKHEEYATSMRAVTLTPAGERLLQEALSATQTIKPFEQEFLRQVQSGDLNGAKDTQLQHARPAQMVLIDILQKLVDEQKTYIGKQVVDLEASYHRTIWFLSILSLAAVAIACWLTHFLTRSFREPLNQAAAVLGEIEKGNYSSEVVVTSHDEIGRTLLGLARMQKALRERTQREHAIAMENARIRTALDRVSVGTMLSDAEGKILYLNDALRTLFRNRDVEIRKQIPSFDAEKMVGGSIEMFHVIPLLQRHQLSTLAATQTADAELGNMNVHLITNPVMENGQRVGTVVQWVDRTQELATEEEVQATVAKAIDGNLTARIEEQGKEGFFKALAIGTNRLLENMADVVRSMAQAAAEVRAGSEEISLGNANLSQRTEEQAASLEQTASSMEEMTSIVRNNADNAAQANLFASAAREQAERGGTVASAAVAAMSAINDSSTKIADIISVIDEIAFQTNLLALNAAVEAARAGEQGRGFAVVAAEVRNLASRSAEAAKEIKALIQDSVGKVTEGTKLVDESGRALGEIVVRVKKVTDVMGEIASSSREQASGIEQVNKAIAMMDDVTQQNAGLVEEASSSAQALTEQASKLTQLIARYQVGGIVSEPPRRTVRPPPKAERAFAVERRAPNRPMNGGKKRAGTVLATAHPPKVATSNNMAADAAEEWKEF